MDRTAEPITQTKDGDPLQTKYYCQVDKSQQHMKVVMEMKAKRHETVEKRPLRYVLVIDVSGSMEEIVGRDNRTLLQRVQLFAELAVRKMGPNDSLAIVTFSDNAKIHLPMMRMSDSNKLDNGPKKLTAYPSIPLTRIMICQGLFAKLHTELYVKSVLKGLVAEGKTNLESGLLTALEAISKSNQLYRASRDCIILFTDGEANEGETTSKKLIASYRKQLDKIKAPACIPVSAFTIGGYHPDLLIEVSRQLGSESFYWLNDEEDFEADMLIPLFLREITNVSDVQIKIETKMHSYFEGVQSNTPHLKVVERHKVKIRKYKKKKKDTSLHYFIHSMPDESPKNMNFNVVLPQFQDLNGVKVVDVVIHYLDENLDPRTIEDYILMSAPPLAIQSSSNAAITGNEVVVSAPANISAFIVKNKQVCKSQREAESVILKVTEQECKKIILKSISNARETQDENSQSRGFREASIEINRIRSTNLTLLPDRGQATEELKRMTETWTSRVNNTNDTVASKRTTNYSLLSSMAASIQTENPTCGGIFKGKQPFMNDDLENKLSDEKKNLQVARRIQSSDIDLYTLKRRVRDAIEACNIEKMEEYLRDLKGLQLFGHPVEDEFIKYVADEIKHRNELESLKRNLRTSLSDDDANTIEVQVEILKVVRDKHNLTFTNEDEESLQNAVNMLAIIKRKRGLRGEIASFMNILALSLIPKNLNQISNAIEKLVRLRNEARGMDDVFTDRDNTALNVTIANLARAKSEIARIRSNIDELNRIINSSLTPQYLDALGDATQQMEEAKTEANIYTGLYTQSDETYLKNAVEILETLKKERQDLIEKIENLIPDLELPMLPRNYDMLSKALEEMLTTKQKAIQYKNIFTKEHEITLSQAAEKVTLLRTKMYELREKIASSSCNIGLSSFPTNMEKIKTAVKGMTEAKNEAAGFVEVFTEQHNQQLQSGIASLRILKAQKEEVQNELNPCLTQLQLSMIPENYEEISEGVKTMKKITPLVKEFSLYDDKYEGLFDKAVFNRDVLEDKRKQIQQKLKSLEPNLGLPAVPENQIPMREAAEKMKSLREAASGYKNLFTSKHEGDLYEITTNLKLLNKKIDELDTAKRKLSEAMASRSYASLKHAIKKANKTTFFEKEKLKEPRKLMSFLDPKTRRLAVKTALEENDIKRLEKALLNMREAAVNDDQLENQAKKTLLTLQKQKKREEKERRRIARERRRREKEIKKLTDNFLSAIVNLSIEDLEQALNDFENSEYSETEIPTAIEAKDLLEQLKIEEMRNRLQEGIKERNFELLLDALIDADYGRFREHMEKEYDEAKELLVYLQEMMRLRDTIQKMTRSSLSEVHKYPHPPKPVKKIMVATYMILGEQPKKLKKWLNVQALMGKLDRNSITKRVLRFRISDLSPEVAKEADSYLKDFNLPDVEEISTVAATLYAWAKYVINEVEFFQKQAEKKQKELEKAEEDSGNYDRESFESDGDELVSEDSAKEHDA